MRVTVEKAHSVHVDRNITFRQGAGRLRDRRWAKGRVLGGSGDSLWRRSVTAGPLRR